MRMTSVLLVAGISTLAGACHDDESVSGPSVHQVVPYREHGDWPDPLLAHARVIPGFGGFFLDQQGQPAVYLKDSRLREAAATALAGTLRGLNKAGVELRVVRAEFDYLELHEWFMRAAPEALALPGAVFADLDEGSNRLHIGVENEEAATRVRGTIESLGIPSQAIVVERTAPILPAATVRDRMIPRRGGIQVIGAGRTCTIGFNTLVSSNYVVIRSFITSSHCTGKGGIVEGTKFYQPAPSVSSSYVGAEVADPPYFTGRICPPGRKCRWSDAARVRYASGVAAELGRIARPTFRAVNGGSITIDAAKPYFSITGEAVPVQGAEVNKVGRSTGWTAKKINHTCISVNVDPDITLLCQSWTYGSSWPGTLAGPGDSGSPVFYWNGGGGAQLVGLLWAAHYLGNAFVFSPISGIERDLGLLKTF